MRRKDLIVFAVLVNVTVLGFLFLLSQRGEREGPSSVYDEWVSLEPSNSQARESSKITSSGSIKDELDQLLEEYTVYNETPSERGKEGQIAVADSRKGSEKLCEVVVKKGDSLDKIARAHGVTVRALKEENKLASERLSIGQLLYIPTSTTAKGQAADLEQEIVAEKKEYYTLKSGDSPWKVAKQFHVPFEVLLELNDLNEEKARKLRPGNVLRVK